MNETKGAPARAVVPTATPRKETTIEEGTILRGSIDSDCGVVVKGGLEGSVTGPSLHIAATGFVSGTGKVGELHSEGELSGEFDADIVRLSGRVKDKTVIRAKTIDVKLKPGASKMELVFGECAVEVGDVPAKEQAVRAAKEPPAPAATTESTAPAPAADVGGGGDKDKDKNRPALPGVPN